MKLLLHVGMSKAGTSAIQEMLYLNRALLMERGFCYPLAGIEGVYAHFGIHHDFTLRNSFAVLRAALAESSQCDVCVLSCESFWLLSSEQIAKFAAELTGVDTEVILYLRSPAGYMPSSYRQAIKHEGVTQDMVTYCRSIVGRLDFPVLLKKWQTHFPLRVRVYEKEKNHLCRSLCEVADIPPEGIIFPSGAVNATPSDGALRVMRYANMCLSPRVSRRARKILHQNERYFKFLPEMDNKAAVPIAREIVAGWDLAVLEQYISKEDMGLLTKAS